MTRRLRVAVLYHYMHPDDVAGGRHFDGLAQDLAARGWQVEALPCNRGCRDEGQIWPAAEDWNGVSYRRVWRPGFRQNSTAGRLLNAAWMIGAWTALALRPASRRPDVIVVGTDPIFGVVVALAVRTLRPEIKLAHWCFDLHPEAALADGMIDANNPLLRPLKSLLKAAYASCDVIADIGACMRERLRAYEHAAREMTLVPWALDEPAELSAPDGKTRAELFGECAIGALYSGNFGRAHSCDEFLELARLLRNDSVQMCFAARGNQEGALRRKISEAGANVSLRDFVPEAELGRHLSAADIHLVSLRPNWNGIVVPSKFFGSLAAGRPVIFAGSHESSIAKIIAEHQVGWVLDESSMANVANEIKEFAKNRQKLTELQRHCHAVYQAHYSRAKSMERWDATLRELAGQAASE